MQWIKKLINTVKYKWSRRVRSPFSPPPCPNGYQYIEIPIAGTNHDDRDRALHRCILHEQVTLLRDPRNINDSNAIKIIAKDSDHIGFVPRLKAAHLAKYMDENNRSLEGFISSLYHATLSKRTLASIVIQLPSASEIFSKLREKVVHFRYEKEYEGSPATLLLDCEDDCLRLIAETLELNSIKLRRYSTALKQASNGLMYRWYIALEEDVGEEKLRDILKHELKLFSPDDQVNEYIKEFELEINELKNKNLELRQENERLKKEIVAKPKSISSPKLQKELKKLLGFIFPEVEFLDESFSIMIEKYKDLEHVFNFTREMATNQNFANFKPEKFYAAPGWFEIRIAGCEHNAGRLYFKKIGKNKWRLHVSCKIQQKRDEELLKKY